MKHSVEVSGRCPALLGGETRCMLEAGHPGPCNYQRSHTISTSPEQGQPPDRYRKVEGTLPWLLLPCRLCGSPAELWQRWERDDIWFSFGCCTNLEDVDGEPCHFHLPDSVAFYLPRKAEAVRYWNLMMGPRPPAVERPTTTLTDDKEMQP